MGFRLATTASVDGNLDFLVMILRGTLDFTAGNFLGRGITTLDALWRTVFFFIAGRLANFACTMPPRKVFILIV